MTRLIRTIVAAALAVLVTAPVFAQEAAPAAQGTAATRQRAPDQRRARRQAVRARRAARMFKRLDKDGNGAISRDEWTRRPQVFERLDANKDGQITADEFRKAALRIPRARRRNMDR